MSKAGARGILALKDRFTIEYVIGKSATPATAELRQSALNVTRLLLIRAHPAIYRRGEVKCPKVRSHVVHLGFL
jgi:hypothetical protein